MELKMKKFKLSEVAGTYSVDGLLTEQDIIKMAQKLARKRLAKGKDITSPDSAREAIKVLMQEHKREVFGVLFLNNKHKVIKFEEVFYGTISECAVHTREIVKLAIKYNSCSIILVHNHPSGDVSPSKSDIAITERIVASLDLIDVRVLDHIIVGADNLYSFAENQLC